MDAIQQQLDFVMVIPSVRVHNVETNGGGARREPAKERGAQTTEKPNRLRFRPLFSLPLSRSSSIPSSARKIHAGG